MTHAITPALASGFATAALGHVEREYPNKLDHVMASDADAQTPLALHPLFYGSFDWHSCVHGYWLLARLLALQPDMPEAGAIRALFARRITPDAVAGELRYLDRSGARGFERPYGWAWLLALVQALPPDAAAVLAPLAAAFVARFHEYLPKLTYPVRAGTHGNTAFALILALDHPDPALAALIRSRAEHWFGADRDCPAWEPGGDDFLSPALTEALCMARVLPAEAFAGWLAGFLPRLGDGEPAALFHPAVVSDRSDGKLAHLDGTNFARAWCFRALARHAPALAPRLLPAAEAHIAASLPHVAGEYMGEHWLASFALMALEG
jgi:hypothetical protein